MTADPLRDRLFAGIPALINALAAGPTVAAIVAFTRRHRLKRIRTAYRLRARRR